MSAFRSLFEGRKEVKSAGRAYIDSISASHKITVKKERSSSAEHERGQVSLIQSEIESKRRLMDRGEGRGLKGRVDGIEEDDKAGILSAENKPKKVKVAFEGDDERHKNKLEKNESDKDNTIVEQNIQLATALKRQDQMMARIKELKKITGAGDHPIDIGIIAIAGDTSTMPFSFGIPLPFAAATVIPPAYDYSVITRMNREGRVNVGDKGKKRQMVDDEV